MEEKYKQFGYTRCGLRTTLGIFYESGSINVKKGYLQIYLCDIICAGAELKNLRSIISKLSYNRLLKKYIDMEMNKIELAKKVMLGKIQFHDIKNDIVTRIYR